MSGNLKTALISHLEFIYPDENHAVLADRIIDVFWPNGGGDMLLDKIHAGRELWSEKTSLLITYADSLLRENEVPLQTLHTFLNTHLKDGLSGVHLLPFFPFSSDDGFSVMDYYEVREDLGTWNDIRDIGCDFDIMSDMVLNHASAKGTWFQKYLDGEKGYENFFISVDPDEDLSMVVRPRSLPLLSPFQTARGEEYLWTTFSDDQIDLNYENPEVLLKMIEVMRLYLDHHVKILRLDAVGFLWKIIGTSCIHLAQTHEVMKLFRTLMEYYRDDVILITETNVPHMENVSYFGDQDEAHVVYNFSLPPLLVYGLLTGDEGPLKFWMKGLGPLPEGCTFFNFVAGHDGIGLRPAAGFLATEQVNSMISTIKEFGGEVSMRAVGASGEEKPYEMNVSLFDALKGTIHGADEFQRERFMASQIFMLGFQGIPALYIHSLLATPNDYALYEKTGHKRSLNRHRWDMRELEAKLSDPQSDQYFALHRLKFILDIRQQEACFHPGARQITLQTPPGLAGYKRLSRDENEYILCVTNLTASEQRMKITPFHDPAYKGMYRDILTDRAYDVEGEELVFDPYQAMWLKFTLA